MLSTCRNSPRTKLSTSAWIVALALATALGDGHSALKVHADDAQQLDARFAAHLAAGEFGPAVQLARGQSDGRRDAWLGRVARAQAQSGARWASSATASGIANHQVRRSAFEDIAGQPFGGSDGRGGAAMADFDTLIELITSTIAPDSWDAVGGPGAIESFPTGVLVDGHGLLSRIPMLETSTSLDSIRSAAREIGRNQDVKKPSRLRKVSLTRLERNLERLWAMGQGPDETMRALAGLQKLKYVLFYPETRDIVLAGPAGDWESDTTGRWVSRDTRSPVLRLDDFVVVLRSTLSDRSGRFGCSITPRQANLAAVQSFLDESAKRALRPGQRDDWLDQLRARLGRQDIHIHGIDPRSRAARILVVADYHMKLIGMGLEDGTLGVTSYLELIEQSGDATPMEVLRWWFTMNYESIRTTGTRDAYEVVGPGVRVLSENELLAATGRRVHTGKSNEHNAAFAHSFTRHFEALALKYPIYAELRNVFDLALVATLMRSEGLMERIDCPMDFFADDGRYQIENGYVPTEVDSVINHRVINKKRILVGVSGGVQADANQFVRPVNFEKDEYGLLQVERKGSAPTEEGNHRWWWD